MGTNNSFKNGINWSDATGQTALDDHIFQSESGNDSTVAPQNPATPYLTLNKATELMNDGDTLILGDCLYTDQRVFDSGVINALNNVTIQSDGHVVFEWPNDGNTKGWDANGLKNGWTIDGIKFTGWSSNGCIFTINDPASNDDYTIIRCVFEGCINRLFMNPSAGLTCQHIFNKYINSSITFRTNSINFAGTAQSKNNQYINTTVDYTLLGDGTMIKDIKNELFYTGSNLICTSDQAQLISNCIIFGTSANKITVDGTPYNNLADAQAAGVLLGESWFPNCLDVDPLYNGNPTNFQFTVQDASPAIQGGEFNTNIGGVKRGNLQSATSAELGTSPDDVGETQFVSSLLELVNRPTYDPATSYNINDKVEYLGIHYNSLVNGNLGNTPDSSPTEWEALNMFRETAPIDLGRVVRSPLIVFNGLSDFINNVFDSIPDGPAPLNPSKLIFEARFSDSEAGLALESYQPFRWFDRTIRDTSNRTPGVQDFTYGAPVDIVFKWVQIRVGLTNVHVIG